MAWSFLWWTWQNQSHVQQGSDEKDPCLVSCSPLVYIHQYFQFMIQKNSKICYSLTIQLWYKCQGSHCVHSKRVWDRQSAEGWTSAMQCNLPMKQNTFPLKGLWQAEQWSSRKEDNGNHSFSSGFWGSMILTWVKGKSPLRPLTSPSHWPFIFILVTFTMSPTCKNGERRQSQHVLCKLNKREN